MEYRDVNGTPIRLEGDLLYFGDEAIDIGDVGIVVAQPREFYGETLTDLTVNRKEGAPFIQTPMRDNQEAGAIVKAIAETSMRKHNEEQGN